MTYEGHFQVVDGAVKPQPWMQLRGVASEEVPSVSKSYATAGGGNKNELLQTVQTHWTNTAPMSQWVYGVVTHEGSEVTLQARSRGYLAMWHGVDISADGAGIVMTDVSHAGGGADIGVAGLLGIGTGFGAHSVRFNSHSIPLMPQVTGWYLVAPGERFNAKVQVRFVSDFWENTTIDGGDQSTESVILSGGVRLDLFAVPSVLPPPPRPVPTIVGWEYDDTITGDTTVDVPAGTAEDDIILAISANHFGFMSELTAIEEGWTLLHGRDGGFADVHMKIWGRVADASEPSSYSFGNGFLAQQITHLITIRDADVPTAWHIASNTGSCSRSRSLPPSSARASCCSSPTSSPTRGRASPRHRPRG
jgi:hypothetical protein